MVQYLAMRAIDPETVVSLAWTMVGRLVDQALLYRRETTLMMILITLQVMGEATWFLLTEQLA